MTTAARELAVIERNLTDAQLREKADLLIKSKFLPTAIQTAEQAMTIIMTGREFGLGLMESLRSINVIQGKPALSAQLMLALCQRTGELEDMKVEETEGSCTTKIKRKGRSEHSYTFTMADAKALGLDTKDNWRKQPKTMLRWRSLSGNLRVTFADAICGLYTDDEAEDIVVDAVQRQDEFNKKVEDHREQIAERVAGPEGTVEPSEVNKLGLTFLKPPFDTAYQSRCLMEIYGDKLPSGDPRGKKFLLMVASKTKDAEERATIEKFIELMEQPS